MKPILAISSLIGLLLLYSSCDYGCGSEYYFAGNNTFAFNILDKATHQNVLELGQHNYIYDTVKVYHENWAVAYPGPVRGDGFIVLRFIDDVNDKGVVNKLLNRRFYMYFNYQDIDTLDFSFEMRYNDCHRQILKYFKVAYNDSVYFDGLSDTAVGQNFIKSH